MLKRISEPPHCFGRTLLSLDFRDRNVASKEFLFTLLLFPSHYISQPVLLRRIEVERVAISQNLLCLKLSTHLARRVSLTFALF